jgi:hypothetical protein
MHCVTIDVFQIGAIYLDTHRTAVIIFISDAPREGEFRQMKQFIKCCKMCLRTNAVARINILGGQEKCWGGEMEYI